tara:strand:+ start:401 stop:811 length:411 start_codon:yes stop_codon:yes gene_type:complete
MRKKNNQYKKKFFIELIDIMIPESKNKLLPKASKVVKTDVLINLLFENSEFKKKLNKLFNKESKNKNFNYRQLALKFFNSKTIEGNIANDLLKLYFSSKIVQKRLNMTINQNKYKKKDNRLLVKLLKNSSLRYKHG